MLVIITITQLIIIIIIIVGFRSDYITQEFETAVSSELFVKS
jgi:hypothetical protein